MAVDYPAALSLTQERGGASLIALITILAALMLTLTYLGMTQAELRMSTRYVQARQALYLAESGIELCRKGLEGDAAWQPQPNYVLATGSMAPVLVKTSNGYRVTVNGIAGTAARKLAADLITDGQGHWKVGSYQEIYN